MYIVLLFDQLNKKEHAPSIRINGEKQKQKNKNGFCLQEGIIIQPLDLICGFVFVSVCLHM